MYNGPGLYRHYKGGLYRVLGLALRENSIKKYRGTTTGVGERFAVYQPLTPGSLLETANYGDCDFWARELANFNDLVEVGSDQCDRFERTTSTPVRIPVTDNMVARFKATAYAMSVGGFRRDETLRACIEAAINGD